VLPAVYSGMLDTSSHPISQRSAIANAFHSLELLIGDE
jgi:hypothetical protein